MGKDKKRKKRKAVKTKESKWYKWSIFLVVAVVSVFLYLGLTINDKLAEENKLNPNIELFHSKLLLLQEHILFENIEKHIESDNILLERTGNKFIVFFSVCNTKNRAKVFAASGESLNSAWENAVIKTVKYLSAYELEPIWVKVDIVDSTKVIKSGDLSDILKNYRSYYFRQGIAFDSSFNIALLEAELNYSGLIDYEGNRLKYDDINKYLNEQGKEAIKMLPENLVLFTTLGWLCDEQDRVYTLYGYEDHGYNYGRRILTDLNKDTIKDIISTSTEWMIDEIKDDGSFVYGYYPIYDERLTHYNILRHIVSIQPLIWYSTLTGRKDIEPLIIKAINYVVEYNIEYRDDITAFVVDRPNNEIKLGGNAVAIIVLKEYMDTFNNDRYNQLLIDLGNGILDLLDQERGTFYHVLNPDFTKKVEYRTVYYDGEATYALAILYEITKDQKWLAAAKAAVENFIREDYTKYRDHWVAYAMNSVTKHVNDQRYYEFALKNVQNNLDEIYYRDTSYHTYLELLMATYELFDRMTINQINNKYVEEFDAGYFFKTIFHRADHMLNSYMFPEYCMYFSNPSKYLGTFVIRHDAYRIRIDDIEHFIAGYYNLWRNYERIVKYNEKYNALP